MPLFQQQEMPARLPRREVVLLATRQLAHQAPLDPPLSRAITPQLLRIGLDLTLISFQGLKVFLAHFFVSKPGIAEWL
jgi:hypothetical protein